MIKQATYHEMTKHFAKQPQKKLKMVWQELKNNDCNRQQSTKYHIVKQNLAWYY
jgi:hypothetical protein